MRTGPMVSGTVPHVGGPIIGPCEPTVIIGFLPAARVTDEVNCHQGPDPIAKDSGSVTIGGCGRSVSFAGGGRC